MLKKEEILEFLGSIKDELRQNGIEKVGLFGSFAKDSADLLSDIDIVIKTSDYFVKKNRGIRGLLYLDDLKRRIKNRFYRDVDICDESGLKNKKVLSEAIYA